MNYNKEAKSLTFRRGPEVSQGMLANGRDVLSCYAALRLFGFKGKHRHREECNEIPFLRKPYLKGQGTYK